MIKTGLSQMPKFLSQSIDVIVQQSKLTTKELRQEIFHQFEILKSSSIYPAFEAAQKKPKIKEKEKSPKIRLENTKKKILQYGDYEALSHLVARFPSHFSILKRIMTELPSDDVREVKSILDFGCGPMTGFWAFHDLFGSRQLEKYVGIDLSESQLFMAQQLLNLNSEQLAIEKEKILLKRYLAHDKKDLQYDLVLASMVFGELASDEIRKYTLEVLWKKTARDLIIVEPGHPEGFRILSELRHFIVNDLKKETPLHILAPCPHDGPCPLYQSTKEWCHFKQRVERHRHLVQIKKANLNFEDASYTYLIVRRGERKEKTKDENQIISGRILMHPSKKKQKVHLKLCTDEGIQQKLITKSQHPELFRQALKSKRGDFFPTSLNNINNNDEDNENDTVDKDND